MGGRKMFRLASRFPRVGLGKVYFVRVPLKTCVWVGEGDVVSRVRGLYVGVVWW